MTRVFTISQRGSDMVAWVEEDGTKYQAWGKVGKEKSSKLGKTGSFHWDKS